MYEMLLSLSVSNSVHGKRLRNNRCVRFEAALRRMISDWFESMRIHLYLEQKTSLYDIHAT